MLTPNGEMGKCRYGHPRVVGRPCGACRKKQRWRLAREREMDRVSAMRLQRRAAGWASAAARRGGVPFLTVGVD
jgi:hypothetical protein